MMNKPLTRRLGTIIHIENECLCDKDPQKKHLMRCYVDNNHYETIPLSFFKRCRGDGFSMRIKKCTCNEELHQLLQGKTLTIVAKRDTKVTFHLVGEHY